MAEPDAGEVRFFYGLGSRYSYLASTQIDRLIDDTGCRVRWRPLYSGDLFGARGVDPFKGAPISGQYDFAYRRFDAECWADYYGVPYREPDDVRFDPKRLALACTAAERQGKAAALSRRLFRAIFADALSPIDDDGLCAARHRRRARRRCPPGSAGRPENRSRASRHHSRALDLGVFGVPSFAFDGAVFFGNDRLPIVRHRLLHRR